MRGRLVAYAHGAWLVVFGYAHDRVRHRAERVARGAEGADGKRAPGGGDGDGDGDGAAGERQLTVGYVNVEAALRGESLAPYAHRAVARPAPPQGLPAAQAATAAVAVAARPGSGAGPPSYRCCAVALGDSDIGVLDPLEAFFLASGAWLRLCVPGRALVRPVVVCVRLPPEAPARSTADAAAHAAWFTREPDAPAQAPPRGPRPRCRMARPPAAAAAPALGALIALARSNPEPMASTAAYAGVLDAATLLRVHSAPFRLGNEAVAERIRNAAPETGAADARLERVHWATTLHHSFAILHAAPLASSRAHQLEHAAATGLAGALGAATGLPPALIADLLFAYLF
jgi:hypothetical protein